MLLILGVCGYILRPIQVTIETPKKPLMIANTKIPNGYIFSVTVDHRHHYLAQKTSQGNYQLLHINQHEPLHICQPIYTTGLDHQFQGDVLIGYISHISTDNESLYQSIQVTADAFCKHQNLGTQ